MYYVGVDLGATNLRATVADATGTLLATRRRPTPAGSRADAITTAVTDAVRTVCRDADTPIEAVDAAGIASVGPLTDGEIRDSPNLAVDGVVPLVDPLRSLLATDRVRLLNDATAGAFAERYYREDPPANLVYLTISSGIGAGAVVDGRVLSGAGGNAGEVGHVVVDPEGRRTCGCGRNGHWEAYGAGEHVSDFARDLATSETDTALALDDPALDAADVYAAADSDAFARRVVDRIADRHVQGVTTLVQAYAPVLVSVGGAVALGNEAHVIDPVRDRLPDASFVDPPRVERTPFGDDAVLRGAVASVLPE